MALGWLYVLTNEAMPNLIKIGQSLSDPHLRASDLFTTGVPRPFVIEYKGLFEDYARLERKVHLELAHFRESPQREFFKISVAQAVDTIRSLSVGGAKYEDCCYITQNQATDDPVIDTLQRRELPWVMQERERRRNNRLSEQFDGAQLRFVNCRKCGEVIRNTIFKCPRCGAPGPGY